MKLLLIILVSILPIHALIVTTLKCKFDVDVNALRFWKEIILIILFIVAIMRLLQKEKFNLARIYKNNYIVGMATAFTISSFIYIFFPFFELKVSAFLGFKYDVFFIVSLIVGLYLTTVKKHFNRLLLGVFGTTAAVLVIFLPWYLLGDISQLSDVFGYSEQVSTYRANQCIAFSQNVEGEHRFQGSFSGPIRWSVFLTIFYVLYMGYILEFLKNTKNKLFKSKNTILGKKIIPIKTKSTIEETTYTNVSKALIVIPSLLVITSIFYSYSKTSMLGLIFAIALFVYLVFKIQLKKSLTSKQFIIIGSISSLPILLIMYIKRDLFLHLGAIINRFDNLMQSIQMFLYNPIGYGLGIAGPASWTGNSIESAGSWQIAVASAKSTHKFLPENWYMQILLEQGIVGLGLFIGFLWVIGLHLYKIAQSKKDFFSIAMFVAFMSLLFMANFTHAFEESATSYLLFLFIGGHLAAHGYTEKIKGNSKKK